ncbi:flagellar hook-associated protein FlgL [Cytobacillus firmus]|uniref:Flagellar hook-associated protein 3 n=1 Tax=Cytobacillus firmus DS1 TaxID=1307436 RepID=W7L8F4_CYTFI|nr:flagellar hook-associated protein FlgL [Cytobacillus firmus]EWG11491.1 flagellar hook-associated protein 3 [Cytobacillus firmus DS1]
MRITQNMLIRNNLNYISNNYERYGEILDQVNSNKKITRPSQDPVIAIKGMEYRSQVVEVEQFQRNLGEVYSWMDNADATLDETTQVLHRIKELTVQASNETYTPDQRNGIAKEVRELQNHLEALANTKVNSKYIFNGTNTSTKPVDISKIGKSISEITADNQASMVVQYKGKEFTFSEANSITGPDETGTAYVFKNGDETLTLTSKEVTTTTDSGDSVTNKEELISYQKGSEDPIDLSFDDVIISEKNAYSTNEQNFGIEIMKGIKINVNIDPQNVFSAEMFRDVSDLINALEEPSNNASDINKFLSKMENHFDKVTAERSDLGARYNRVELIQERLGQQDTIAKKTMSDNEDIDFEKAVTDLKIQESIHRAALAVGARIIQPTLMDFLR